MNRAKCKTLDRGGWRGRPCSLQRPKPRHPVGIDFTIVPSSSTKRDTSPFGTTLKFLVHTVLVQFLECVPIRRGEIGRFLRLQTQHATQIRDCFLVDQTLRAARTCYVARNSFRLPENSKATEQTPFSAVWPGRPRSRDKPRNRRKKTIRKKAKMKCRHLPTPCSSPFRVSWLFLVIFGFPSGQDRFSKLSRAFPPEKENGRTVPREIRRAFSLATDGGYCQTCPKRKCFRFSWSFYTTHSGLRFLHRTGIALSRSVKTAEKTGVLVL